MDGFPPHKSAYWVTDSRWWFTLNLLFNTHPHCWTARAFAQRKYSRFRALSFEHSVQRASMHCSLLRLRAHRRTLDTRRTSLLPSPSTYPFWYGRRLLTFVGQVSAAHPAPVPWLLAPPSYGPCSYAAPVGNPTPYRVFPSRGLTPECTEQCCVRADGPRWREERMSWWAARRPQ